jgi:hypothetical protein
MTHSLLIALQLLSAGVLGLLIGALLAEAFLLIPVWRSMPAEAFFAGHADYGPRLYRFFAPLTVAATMLAVAAAGAAAVTSHPGRWSTLGAGVSGGALVAIYFAYFRRANARFAAGGLTADELSQELARWAGWHAVRVVVGCIALGLALLGVGGIG